MTVAAQIAHRLIENTALPYKTFQDLTSDEPNLVAGANLLTSSKNTMERRPGFADNIESGTPTAFTSAAREYKWSKWGGTRFFSMICDIDTVAKVYKLEVGVDTAYSLLFTSTSAEPFDFAVSNNTLYYGNGTDMRAWSGTGADRKWGIVRPSAAPTIGTAATGTSIYSGWFYRYTYTASGSNDNESSASDLSTCTGLLTNQKAQITLVASADSQVDGINLYRTTDGGSAAPAEMQLVGSYTNANQTVDDILADGILGTRTCPGTTTNDPPTPSAKLQVSVGRIFTANNASTYFSGLEELNGFSANEECFPSGVTGNSYPWDGEVTAQAGVSDGIAVFQRGRIWKIEGDRRDNFRRYKLVERRGAINHAAVVALGDSVAWLDTANQVWVSSQGEVGYDIRTDIAGIDHSQAYMTVHISGKFHWLCLLDGANAKLYVFDLDTNKWMAPWPIQSATSASCLSSGESSAGNTVLTLAYNQSKVLSLNPASYLDNGVPYAAFGTLNLLRMSSTEKPDIPAAIDYIALDTNSVINSDVLVVLDDDPGKATAQSLIDPTLFPDNPQNPPLREQGVDLLRKEYRCMPEVKNCERASFRFEWAAQNTNFVLYTIDIGRHPGNQ